MRYVTIALSSFLLVLAASADADDMTLMIEQDLERLGYDTGDVDGEETLETTIAISKFQAMNNLDVTGEVSRDLLRALVAAPAPGPAAAGTTTVTAAPATPTESPKVNAAALQAAREACLQEKVTAAKAADKKRGVKRLFGAIARTASRTGHMQVLENINEIYSASATADDIAVIAEELGISEEDVIACGNPTAQQ